MWSSQAFNGRSSGLFKYGVLKPILEGLLACINVESSNIHWESSCLFKCGVLMKHTLESLLACLNVEFSAYIGRSSCLFKCGVLKHTLEGLLACLNVEFSSIHWEVFLLV